MSVMATPPPEAGNAEVDAFVTRTRGGARFFGLVFLGLAPVSMIGGLLLGDAWAVVDIVLAVGFLKAANDCFASLLVESTGLSYRRPIFSRRMEFSSVNEITRKRSAHGDTLAFRPRRGLAIRFAPRSFDRERELRRALRACSQGAGLLWP